MFVLDLGCGVTEILNGKCNQHESFHTYTWRYFFIEPLLTSLGFFMTPPFYKIVNDDDGCDSPKRTCYQHNMRQGSILSKKEKEERRNRKYDLR